MRGEGKPEALCTPSFFFLPLLLFFFLRISLLLSFSSFLLGLHFLLSTFICFCLSLSHHNFCQSPSHICFCREAESTWRRWTAQSVLLSCLLHKVEAGSCSLRSGNLLFLQKPVKKGLSPWLKWSPPHYGHVVPSNYLFLWLPTGQVLLGAAVAWIDRFGLGPPTQHKNAHTASKDLITAHYMGRQCIEDVKRLQTPHRSLQIAKIRVHLWSHINHINPSSFSTRALVYCGILKFPEVFQKVFVLGKWKCTWFQRQYSSTQSACHCTAQSAPVETSSLPGSEDILWNLQVFPTSAAVQQILHLIWQTMLSHLGDKYGKDILSFWQALRFYVPIFFCQGFQYRNKCQPIPYFFKCITVSL